MHRYSGWGWHWWWGLGSVKRRSWLSLGGWNHFADDTVNKKRKKEKSNRLVESN